MLVNIASTVKLGRKDDFWQDLPATLRRMDAATTSRALETLLRQGRKTWVIVGDRARIEGPLRQQLPSLQILDVEGRVVE